MLSKGEVLQTEDDMESSNFLLETVKERFSKYGSDVASLYYNDAEFHAICEDYYMLIQHLNKDKKDFSEKLESIEEYKKALGELEKELEERLKKRK